MDRTRGLRRRIDDRLQEAGLALDLAASVVEVEDAYSFELHHSMRLQHEAQTQWLLPGQVPDEAEVFAERGAAKRAKARRNKIAKRASAFTADPRAVLNHLGVDVEQDGPRDYRRKIPDEPFAIDAPVAEIRKCGRCRGKGIVKCPQCKGSRKVSAGTRRESHMTWELDHVPGHQGNSLYDRGWGGTPIAHRPVQKTREVPVSKPCPTCGGDKWVQCPECVGGGRLADVTSVVLDGRLERTTAGLDDLPKAVRQHITDRWDTLDAELAFEVIGSRDNGRKLTTTYRGQLETVAGSFTAKDGDRQYPFRARGIAGVTTIIDAEPVLDAYLADEMTRLEDQPAGDALRHVQSHPLLRVIASRFSKPLTFLRRSRAPRFEGLLSPGAATAAARKIARKRISVVAPVALVGLAASGLVWGGIGTALRAGIAPLHPEAAVAVSCCAPAIAWFVGRWRLGRYLGGGTAGAEAGRMQGLLDRFWWGVGVPATLATVAVILMLNGPY